MAKTTKTAASKKPAAKADDKVKPSDMMKMPSEAAVKAIARDVTTTKDSVGELNGDLATAIAAAKKDKGVHPGALKRVVALVTKAKETDRGLAAVATEIAHFEYYCDVLGLTKMLAEQGQMFARTEAGETADDKPKPGPQLSLVEDAAETEAVH